VESLSVTVVVLRSVDARRSLHVVDTTQEQSDPSGGDEREPDGAEQGDLGAIKSRTGTGPADERDGAAGWSTPKVVGLLAAVVFVAVLMALALQSRFDGQPEDSVDVGFLQDMIAHHEQAIQLGLLGVHNAADDDVAHFAQESIVAQQWEIGYMTALLEDWGFDTGDLDRDTMTWMDMPTSIEDMPGMATAEEMAAFRRASGAEADAMFLELMSRHHQGGIHMAEEAAERAGDDRVRELAERMAFNQQREIAEYRATAENLGIELNV
jgi:uncharacterized protein (DUF305 family)